LGRYLCVEADVILKKVRDAAVKHADETGWKINGVNHWLWAFVNEMWAYYQIDRSRGSKVVKAVLGNPVPGVLVLLHSVKNRSDDAASDAALD